MRLLFIFVFAVLGSFCNAQRVLIHCGNLLDGKSDQVQPQMTIVVVGNKIAKVENGFIQPDEDDILIDLSSKTVMPGLIDLHVHLEEESSKNSSLEKFTLNDADIAFRAAQYAQRTLMAGFTTVRDLGGVGVNIALRNAINQNITVGPRVFTAGKYIASTGGHGDRTNSFSEDLMGDPGPADGVVNSVDDARKAVRQRYKEGSDLIKITATGGVISLAKDGSGPQFSEEEIKAIVTTAKDYRMHVAAHAHGPEGMKRAVLAGVTTIEHGTQMTEEIMDLMKERGTYYVPTITAGKYVAEKSKEVGYYHPLVAPKAAEIGPQIQKTFEKALKRGVPIAFGTDAGVYPHGENGKEFFFMVEAGMKPIDAIKSATIVNAKILGIASELGSIEAGKIADIVATDDNPLINIKALESVTFVMKDGVVYKDANRRFPSN